MPDLHGIVGEMVMYKLDCGEREYQLVISVIARDGGNPEGWDFNSTQLEFYMQIKITLVYQTPGM